MTGPTVDVAALFGVAGARLHTDGLLEAAQMAAGGVLVLPPGVVRYDRTLHLPSGTRIGGRGRGTTELRYEGDGAAVQVGSLSDPAYRCDIHGLTITNPTGSATVGLDMNHARECEVSSVRVVEGFAVAAVRNAGSSSLAGAWSNKYERLLIQRVDGDGIIIGTGSNAVSLVGCHVTSSGGSNLKVTGQVNGLSVLGQFENAGSGAEVLIEAATVMGLDLLGCYFETKPDPAARCVKAQGTVSMEGFHLAGAYQYGHGQATHAVETAVASGHVYGKVGPNYTHGFTVAEVKAGTNTRLHVEGFAGLGQFFPSGGRIALLENAGGRGCSVEQADQRLIVTGGDMEAASPGRGWVVRSPNGTRYRLGVSDIGAVTATAL